MAFRGGCLPRGRAAHGAHAQLLRQTRGHPARCGPCLRLALRECPGQGGPKSGRREKTGKGPGGIHKGGVGGGRAAWTCKRSVALSRDLLTPTPPRPSIWQASGRPFRGLGWGRARRPWGPQPLADTYLCACKLSLTAHPDLLGGEKNGGAGCGGWEGEAERGIGAHWVGWLGVGDLGPGRGPSTRLRNPPPPSLCRSASRSVAARTCSKNPGGAGDSKDRPRSRCEGQLCGGGDVGKTLRLQMLHCNPVLHLVPAETWAWMCRGKWWVGAQEGASARTGGPLEGVGGLSGGKGKFEKPLTTQDSES